LKPNFPWGEYPLLYQSKIEILHGGGVAVDKGASRALKASFHYKDFLLASG
jgi:hypothetical protein